MENEANNEGERMQLDDHPSVIAYRQAHRKMEQQTVMREWLKEIVRLAGADDVGIVEIDRTEIEDQKQAILAAFPRAKTLISFVCRLNGAHIHSPDRTLADGEFIALDAEMRLISRKVARILGENGVAAIAPAENFPQDMDKWPGRMFIVSHKPVAAAAGLGRIGHHRLLIHPQFGSHICLGTLVIDAAADSYDRPLDFDPCISCKLCVGVCPTGAIGKDGSFSFRTCLVHAYRDRLGGFLSWTEALVTSADMKEYRQKRNDGETMAVWQSLTYGGGFRCGYCMAVCPAGVDLIGPYIENRKGYVETVVKPLQEKKECVYVIPGSEAEASLPGRLPSKSPRPV